MPSNGAEYGSGGPTFQPDREQAIGALCVALKSGDIKKIESVVCDHEITDKEIRHSRVQDVVVKAFPSFCARHADTKEYLKNIEMFLMFIPFGPSVIHDPHVQELAQDLFHEACISRADVHMLQLFQNTFRIDEEYVSEEVNVTLQDCLEERNYEYTAELMISFQTVVRACAEPELSIRSREILETICDEEWNYGDYKASAKLFSFYKDILAPIDTAILVEKIENHISKAIDGLLYDVASLTSELDALLRMISAYGMEDSKRFSQMISDAIGNILDDYIDIEQIREVVSCIKRLNMRDALCGALSQCVGKALIAAESETAHYIAAECFLTPDELKLAADMYIAYLPTDIQDSNDHYENEYGVVDHEQVHIELRNYIENLNSLGVNNITIAELCLEYDLTDYLMSMRDELGLSREEWHSASLRSFIQALEGGEFDVITTFYKYDLIADELDKEHIAAATPLLWNIIDLFDINTVSGLIKVVKREKELMNNATTVGDVFLMKKDLAICRDLHIPLSEGNRLIFSKVDLSSLHALKGEDRYMSLLQKLLEHGDQWRNSDETVVGPLKRAAEIFGYGKMFYYCDRKDLSRHDALFAMDAIIALQKFSGLTPQEFFGRILKQVAMDDAHYDEGTAHHRMNAITTSFSQDIDNVLAKAAKYSDIPKLCELASTFKTKQDVFRSWTALKKYAELSQLVGQTDILRELQELKKREGESRLYHFIEKLAFHPTSKVSLRDVMMFWRQPEKFLDKDDNHAIEGIHERKKPSNYTHIPNLDLTAVEVRDALVNGALDRLQSCTPFEIEYCFQDGTQDMREDIQRALGVRSQGQRGQASNPRKLYFEFKKMCNEQRVDFDAYLRKAISISDDLETELKALLYNPTIGIAQGEEEIYRAKISAKSDPDGILAGNDTACCMSFDSGKNAVYMFNPVTAIFTIQRKRADSIWRTVAQSVLTKDKDIGMSVPKILSELQHDKHLSDVIPADVLEQSTAYLSADNIEVAPNAKEDQRTVEAIETIYQDFFAEYLKRYAVQQGLHSTQVPVGMGYTDAVTSFSRANNTFVPLAPVSYSDKTDEQTYLLNAAMRVKSVDKKIIERDGGQTAQTPVIGSNAIGRMTFEDTLAVAYLEGKIYKDNQELIVNLHNIENGLIAKDIANELKGRPNMSFKYTDGNGRMCGYLFAYEGKMTECDDELYIEDHNLYGKPVIYISDLASDKSNPFIGGRLIKTFFEEYKKNYLDKGIDMSIYFDARETTSYTLLMNQIETIQQWLGVVFTIDELGSYEKGKDTMRAVVLIPHKRADKAA